MEIGAAGSTASSFIPSLKQWAAMAGWSWDTQQTESFQKAQLLDIFECDKSVLITE